MKRILAGLGWLATTLVASPLPSSGSTESAHHKIGYIDVSVATLWTDPEKARPIDKPALTNPAHIEQWLDSMTTAQFLDLTTDGRTQTQALYGARVHILQQNGSWYEIAVPGQPTPKNALGYPGFVPIVQVSFDATYGELQANRPFAEVNKVATTKLYRNVEMSEAIMTMSYDTRLPVLRRVGDAVEVAVPGGRAAYVSCDDVTIYESVASIPYPSGKDIVNAGKMFLGRPYLWGGTSGFAFDCSGFTHTLYDAHGITIGRDADAQADFVGHGVSVAQSDLQPGDIIFYASNLSDPSTIYHDALYAGDGQMIEAYGAGVPVRITPVRFNSSIYWGAERYLH